VVVSRQHFVSHLAAATFLLSCTLIMVQ